MSETEVIETRGDFRVRIELDEAPSEPENEAGFPVFHVEYGGRSARFTRYGTDILDGESALKRFVDYYGASDGMLTFERWVTIFHDGKVIQRNDVDRYGTYLAYTCRELAEKYGIPDEANVPEADEWCAYADGDVWGVIVEERVLAHHNARTRAGTPVYDYDAEEWREVDSCWGYYGSEYARQAASETLKSWTES